MDKQILMFGNIEIEKKFFFTTIRLLFLKGCKYWENISIKQDFFWWKKERNFKYFIAYLYDDHKVKALHIMLPKTRVYIKIITDKLWDVFFDWRLWFGKQM